MTSLNTFWDQVREQPEFFIIGDQHLRSNTGGSLDFQGQQPLEITLNCMEEILESAVFEHTPVYLAGDLFDKPNFNHLELARIIALFNKYSVVEVFMIRGNHDTLLTHRWGKPYPTNHVLYVVCEACPNVQVVHTNLHDMQKHIYRHPIVEEDKVEQINFYALYFLPYMKSDTAFIQALEDIKLDVKNTEANLKTLGAYELPVKVYPCLICHQSIAPLVPDVSVEAHHFDGFRWVWNGHIHGRAVLGNPATETGHNIRILGSLTYQTLQDRQDGNPDKGYYRICLQHKKDRYEIEEIFQPVNCPKIYEVEVGQTAPEGQYILWTQSQEDSVQVQLEEHINIDDESTDGRLNLISDFTEGLGLPELALEILSEMTGALDTGNSFRDVLNLEFGILKMEGFLSYADPVQYDLSYNGRTYIQGLEGSGKSNIIKAFVWVLTGNYWNRSKKFTDPTSYVEYANQAANFQGCRVELEFTRNGEPFTIVRTAGRYKGSVYGETLAKGVLLFNRHEPTPQVENFDHIPGFDDIAQGLRRNNAKLLQFMGLTVNDIIYTIAIRPEYSDLISAEQSQARTIFDSLVGADWVDSLVNASKDKYRLALTDKMGEEQKVEQALETLEASQSAKASILSLHEEKVEQYSHKEEEAATQLNTARNQLQIAKAEVLKLTQAVKILQKQAPKVENGEEIRRGEALIKNQIDVFEGHIRTVVGAGKEIERCNEELAGIEERKTKAQQALQTVLTAIAGLEQKIEEKKAQSGENTFQKLTDMGEEQALEVGSLHTDIERLNLQLESLGNQILGKEYSLKQLTESGVNCQTCQQPLPEDQQETALTQLTKEIENLRSKEKTQIELKAQKQQAHKTQTQVLQAIEEEREKQGAAEKQIQHWEMEKGALSGSLPTKRQAVELVGTREKELRSTIEQANQALKRVGESADSLMEKLGAEKEKLTQVQSSIELLEQQEQKLKEYESAVIEPIANQLIKAENQEKEKEQLVARLEGSVKTLEENRPGQFPDNWTIICDGVEDNEGKLEEAEHNLKVQEDREKALGLINKKVLNSKGLKPYVIGKKLSAINLYCILYSQTVGNVLQIRVDAKGNYIFDVSFDDTVRDGASLSTGWTFHANMTVLGALTKEREKRTKVNLIFVDEPFATIPEGSVERVSMMIDKVSQGKAVHIITHSQTLDLTLARTVQIAGGIEDGMEVISRIEI